ncbi:unnamed protein product, partial [Nesidiocoris tenuis]
MFLHQCQTRNILDGASIRRPPDPKTDTSIKLQYTYFIAQSKLALKPKRVTLGCLWHDNNYCYYLNIPPLFPLETPISTFWPRWILSSPTPYSTAMFFTVAVLTACWKEEQQQQAQFLHDSKQDCGTMFCALEPIKDSENFAGFETPGITSATQTDGMLPTHSQSFWQLSLCAGRSMQSKFNFKIEPWKRMKYTIGKTSVSTGSVCIEGKYPRNKKNAGVEIKAQNKQRARGEKELEKKGRGPRQK